MLPQGSWSLRSVARACWQAPFTGPCSESSERARDHRAPQWDRCRHHAVWSPLDQHTYACCAIILLFVCNQGARFELLARRMFMGVPLVNRLQQHACYYEKEKTHDGRRFVTRLVSQKSAIQAHLRRTPPSTAASLFPVFPKALSFVFLCCCTLIFETSWIQLPLRTILFIDIFYLFTREKYVSHTPFPTAQDQSPCWTAIAKWQAKYSRAVGIGLNNSTKIIFSFSVTG